MTFPLAVKVFDLGDVFFFLFGNDVGTCGKEIIAMTLSLSFVISKTFLMVLIFFANLALVGRLLSTRNISKGKVNRLILPKVLFFGESMPSKALGINLLGT